MAKYAILSDIHANYHALSAVIDDVRSQECTDLVCLGDIVGYNAYPRECLDYIRSLNCPVVLGDHDEAVADPSIAQMSPAALNVIQWTRDQLAAEDLAWLASLKFHATVKPETGFPFALVHASMDHPSYWTDVVTPNDADRHFSRQITPLCFHGHTHIPKIFTWDGVNSIQHYEILYPLSLEDEAIFAVRPNIKYLINVGSVGAPRDGDPRACYTIYDTDRNYVIIRHVAYDISAAQEAIFAAGLPEHLAMRLVLGER